MPDFLTATPWASQVLFVLGGVFLGLFTERFLVRALHSYSKRTDSTMDDLLIEAVHGMPLVWWTTAGVWAAALRGELSPSVREWVTNGTVIVHGDSCGWCSARAAPSDSSSPGRTSE